MLYVGYAFVLVGNYLYITHLHRDAAPFCITMSLQNYQGSCRLPQVSVCRSRLRFPQFLWEGGFLHISDLYLAVLPTRRAPFRFQFLKNGSDDSGSACRFLNSGSDDSSFQFLQQFPSLVRVTRTGSLPSENRADPRRAPRRHCRTLEETLAEAPENPLRGKLSRRASRRVEPPRMVNLRNFESSGLVLGSSCQGTVRRLPKDVSTRQPMPKTFGRAPDALRPTLED